MAICAEQLKTFRIAADFTHHRGPQLFIRAGDWNNMIELKGQLAFIITASIASLADKFKKSEIGRAHV